jgi:hypothetical protein
VQVHTTQLHSSTSGTAASLERADERRRDVTGWSPLPFRHHPGATERRKYLAKKRNSVSVSLSDRVGSIFSTPNGSKN